MVIGISGYDLVLKEDDLMKPDTLSGMSHEGAGLDLCFYKPRKPDCWQHTKLREHETDPPLKFLEGSTTWLTPGLWSSGL